MFHMQHPVSVTFRCKRCHRHLLDHDHQHDEKQRQGCTHYAHNADERLLMHLLPCLFEYCIVHIFFFKIICPPWVDDYCICLPSKNLTVRLVSLACSSLWVTITMVRPSSLFSLCSRSITSAPILESRLPVGSSARMMSGLPIMARAMATRWH